MKTKWILASVALGMIFVVGAQAQIIQNGDFTQGADGLKFWTKNTGTTGAISVFNSTQVILGQTVPLDPSDTAFVALAWKTGTDSPNISQTTGPASPPITISFDYDLQSEVVNQNNFNPSSTLDLFINGNDVASVPLSPLGTSGTTGWTAFSYTDSLYSGDLDIEFDVENAGSTHYDFSAELANISAVEVPDSCSTALLLSGVFSALGFIKRKKV